MATPDLVDPARTVQPGERQRVLGLARGPSDHAFVDAASAYLDGTPADGEVMVLMLAALARLHLGEPAREVLRRFGSRSNGLEAGQVAELRRCVDALPSGRVAWSELDEMFQANLAALDERADLGPSLRGVLEAARDDHEIYRDASGQLHLARRVGDGPLQWQPAFSDESVADGLDLPLRPTGPVPVLVGLGLNTLLEKAFDLTSAPPGSPTVPLYVIDDCPAHLMAWLHAGDRTRLLQASRVYLFGGTDALERIETHLETHEDVPLPSAFLKMTWSRDLATAARALTERLQAHRQRTLRDLTEAIAARDRARDRETWLARIRPGGRVVGFTSHFTTMLQYSMRDIGHAFEDLGYEFVVKMARDDHCEQSALSTARTIHDLDPALVVLINHFSRAQPESFGAVPLLTWIQDPLESVMSPETGRSIGPLDFVCGYYHERCLGEFEYPIERFFSSVIPVSTRLFHDGPVPEDEGRTLECDLMYVGHLHRGREEHIAHWRTQTPPSVHGLLDHVAAEVTDRFERGEHIQDALPLVEETAAQLGGSLPPAAAEQIASFFAYRLFDILFRRQTLGWAADWARRTGARFRLYGRGWEDDPDLADVAVGPIEHGEPLRRAYRSARLVLQTLPAGFHHQRTYEGLASGSLVVARYTPAMFGHLSIEAFRAADTASLPECAAHAFPELERVVFQGPAELDALGDHLLGNATEHERLRRVFRDVVMSRFTYRAIVSDLVTWMTGAAERRGS